MTVRIIKLTTPLISAFRSLLARFKCTHAKGHEYPILMTYSASNERKIIGSAPGWSTPIFSRVFTSPHQKKSTQYSFINRIYTHHFFH